MRELLEVQLLRPHALVGGTALALRYGHRLSVDLDLFTTEPIDTGAMIAQLETQFSTRFSFRRDQQAKWAVFGFIDGVKVDIVHFPHRRIAGLHIESGIPMYADADIAAMKIEAILHRAKKKDFHDLELLLRMHGLAQVMEWHREKYPDNSLAISIPYAITYFKDAEDSEDPISLQGQTWEGVKASIQRSVRDFLS
ncbi:MAG: nucleotidyl transferase AbiEii/AbiGii toxin family protein [Flavobacteriales bacterium]|nr:nucleotidyl transferase AbiEii/AbiGii toxin family protein [Flavobacteriales bacterium]